VSEEINIKTEKEKIIKNDPIQEIWYCPNCKWHGTVNEK
jgi:uncharacterized protein YlaI